MTLKWSRISAGGFCAGRCLNAAGAGSIGTPCRKKKHSSALGAARKSESRPVMDERVRAAWARLIVAIYTQAAKDYKKTLYAGYADLYARKFIMSGAYGIDTDTGQAIIERIQKDYEAHRKKVKGCRTR